MRKIARGVLVLLLLVVCIAPLASAQSFSGDARNISMGGVGYQQNIATGMIEERQPHFDLAVPLGLIQLVRNRDRFDPESDQFDPVLLMEYVASPLNIVFGRNDTGVRSQFISDLVNDGLSRDLNDYRGFVPANGLVAEGLAAPSFGGTLKLIKTGNGTFHGIYVGAGPYVSAGTNMAVDPALTSLLASATPVQAPNQSFFIDDVSSGQLALSITAGYRGRIALSSVAEASNRNGVYVGANYHYLYGFAYEAADMRFRFDTDADGLVVLAPTTVPALIDRTSSRSGRGFALDFGVAVVKDRWEVGFGANGIGNRIDWRDMRRSRYTLSSLVAGSDFLEESLPVEQTTLRVELPVQYTGSVAYYLDAWSLQTQIGHGFQGTTFHGGVERRFGPIALRGGTRYSLERWHPAGGIGLNLTRRFSIDTAFYTTTTNIERQNRAAFALSLRFNR